MVAEQHALDNIFWHALAGPQARFALGNAVARRFARDYSPIIAFADAQAPDFAAIAPWCEPGERFYCDGWTGRVPRGWRLELDSTMYKMVWDGPVPDEPAPGDAPGARPLDARDARQALELATLTRPGPFGPKTIELGEYFGVFEDSRLVAMAGERVFAAGWREISGVCTHPDRQGRGLARRLMNVLLRRQMRRGEQPFLHVASTNTGAVRMYERMGFRIHRESAVRVVSPEPGT